MTIELTSESGNRVFNCRTADVSLRGVRLMLDHSLPLNATVRVKVKLGRHAHQFDHEGRVAWCRLDSAGGQATGGLHNAGIEFTTLPGPIMDEWRNELFALLK